jgi:pimeloyl-ACP methyl ester carboxylesterase
MSIQFRTSLTHAACALGAIAVTAFLAGCGSSNAADLPPAQPSPTTVVLVHGAWADGSSWDKVTAQLQQRGLNVVAVQLPRKSLADDAATVRRAVDAQPGQVVLVGHSYGGAVITEAGTDAKVATMVYVDAFAPGDGESIGDLTSPYPAAPWQAGLIKDSAGYLTLSTDVYLNNFAADVAPAEARIMASSQGPISAQALLFDKVTVAAWKSKPSYFVIGGNDQIVPPAFQQGEAERIKAQVTTIAGASHVSMVSHPNEVAKVILSATASVNGI